MREPSVHSNRGGGFLSRLKPKLGARNRSDSNSSYGQIDQTPSAPVPARQPSADTLTPVPTSAGAEERESLADTSFASIPASTSTPNKRASIIPGMLRRRNSSKPDTRTA